MKVIWKYELVPNDIVKIEMPKGAEILSIQNQFGAVRPWAIVDDTADNETRSFYFCGTGHPVADNPKKYLATIIQGQFVWHIFELSVNLNKERV